MIKEGFINHCKNYLDNLDCDSNIKKSIRYSLISNGKYIRPLLFLLLMDEEDSKEYYDIAMAIECIHVFSLIHDDLPCMDDDNYRRGIKTNHIIFGEDIALLAGDALLNMGYEIIINSNIENNKKVLMLKEFSSAIGLNKGMIHGQILDINDNVNGIDDLNNIHFQKTGRLIELPFVLYAILNNKEDVENYRILGREIGIVYQIQDDYLDKYGLFEEVGKTIGSDEYNNKKTYVSFYEKVELENIIKNKFENIKVMCEKLNIRNNGKDLIYKIAKRSS